MEQLNLRLVSVETLGPRLGTPYLLCSATRMQDGIQLLMPNRCIALLDGPRLLTD